MFSRGKVLAVAAIATTLNVSIVYANTTNSAISISSTVSSSSVSSTANLLNQNFSGDTRNTGLPVNTKRNVYAMSSDSKQYVIVHKGQTLWSIAHNYGVSVADLEQWNQLNSHSILHIGQRLVVKQATSKKGTLTSRDGSVDDGMAAAEQGLEVAQFSERFLGAPYAWGGSSPAGFDCSGFVRYVYAHFGYSLPHTSYGQFEMGSAVNQNELTPGDLVFFDTTGSGASHVGIYVGNGKFISAAGNSIRYDNFNESYWASNFVGAKRIIS